MEKWKEKWRKRIKRNGRVRGSTEGRGDEEEKLEGMTGRILVSGKECMEEAERDRSGNGMSV